MSDERVEIFGTIIHETDKAILLNDGDREVWLPISQISYSGGGVGDDVIVEMEEWLAIDKNLV